MNRLSELIKIGRDAREANAAAFPDAARAFLATKCPEGAALIEGRESESAVPCPEDSYGKIAGIVTWVLDYRNQPIVLIRVRMYDRNSGQVAMCTRRGETWHETYEREAKGLAERFAARADAIDRALDTPGETPESE